eukprot:3175081-Rhodomonas_salina.1
MESLKREVAVGPCSAPFPSRCLRKCSYRGTVWSTQNVEQHHTHAVTLGDEIVTPPVDTNCDTFIPPRCHVNLSQLD